MEDMNNNRTGVLCFRCISYDFEMPSRDDGYSAMAPSRLRRRNVSVASTCNYLLGGAGAILDDGGVGKGKSEQAGAEEVSAHAGSTIESKHGMSLVATSVTARLQGIR